MVVYYSIVQFIDTYCVIVEYAILYRVVLHVLERQVKQIQHLHSHKHNILKNTRTQYTADDIIQYTHTYIYIYIYIYMHT